MPAPFSMRASFDKKRIWTVILIICLCVFAVSSVIIIKQELSAKRSQENANAIAEEVRVEQKTVQNHEYVSPIDFDTLKSINSEIIAWIHIDDTVIDYPICFRESDNSYYLNHDFEGNKTYQGSIFIENCNNQDFNDFNTAIYGHSLLNGNMFYDLHKFSKKAFFEEHDSIIIYLPDETRYYTIFSVKKVSNEHIFYSLNNNDANSRQNFLERILNKEKGTLLRENIEVSTNDKIITLSTCVDDDSKRLHVYAVLTKTIKE